MAGNEVNPDRKGLLGRYFKRLFDCPILAEIQPVGVLCTFDISIDSVLTTYIRLTDIIEIKVSVVHSTF